MAGTKRPRGLWKSQQKDSDRTSPGSFAPEDPRYLEDEESPAVKKFKRERAEVWTQDHSLHNLERASVGVEDWEDLKELFSDAIERYENNDLKEAAELLRGVVHECNRLLRHFPDPSLLYMAPNPPQRYRSFSPSTPPSELRVHRGWPEDFQSSPGASSSTSSRVEKPNAFHYIYGTALFLLGKILEAEPSLAKEGEPTANPAFYLAALDVFEAGDQLKGGREDYVRLKEDWRMAIVWGRSLVSLAEDRLQWTSRSPMAPTSPLLHFDDTRSQSSYGTEAQEDDEWPHTSSFGASVSRKPTIIRRISLRGATPHEILLQAIDQFSRGMLYMPNRKRPTSYPFSPLLDPLHEEFETMDVIDVPPSLPGLSYLQAKDANAIRPRVLFTIASEVLSVAERLEEPEEREHWASWADGVLMQLEIEAASSWACATAVGRGRSWLIIGSSRSESLEPLLESEGVSILTSQEALEAQDALHRAIEHFEKSRKFTQKPKGLNSPVPSSQLEVPSLLGEALVTLAALTLDGPEKDGLLHRAQEEGVDINDVEDDEEEMSPSPSETLILVEDTDMV